MTDIKNRLSEFLGYVRQGETVRVYDRTTPVADIVPLASLEKRDLDKRLADLEAKGVLKRGHRALPDSFFSEMDRNQRPKADSEVLHLLLKDRRAPR